MSSRATGPGAGAGRSTRTEVAQGTSRTGPRAGPRRRSRSASARATVRTVLVEPTTATGGGVRSARRRTPSRVSTRPRVPCQENRTSRPCRGVFRTTAVSVSWTTRARPRRSQVAIPRRKSMLGALRCETETESATPVPSGSTVEGWALFIARWKGKAPTPLGAGRRRVGQGGPRLAGARGSVLRGRRAVSRPAASNVTISPTTSSSLEGPGKCRHSWRQITSPEASYSTMSASPVSSSQQVTEYALPLGVRRSPRRTRSTAIPCHRSPGRSYASSSSVTGPSFTSETAIRAPNTPPWALSAAGLARRAARPRRAARRR